MPTKFRFKVLDLDWLDSELVCKFKIQTILIVLFTGFNIKVIFRDTEYVK